MAENNEFLNESATARVGLVAEFTDFLKCNKKWWLLPILLASICIGILATLAAYPAISIFIYPIF